jgi:hypothetical protein
MNTLREDLQSFYTHLEQSDTRVYETVVRSTNMIISKYVVPTAVTMTGANLLRYYVVQSGSSVCSVHLVWIIFGPDIGGSIFLRNTGERQSNYITSQPSILVEEYGSSA